MLHQTEVGSALQKMPIKTNPRCNDAVQGKPAKSKSGATGDRRPTRRRALPDAPPTCEDLEAAGQMQLSMRGAMAWQMR